MYLQPEHLTAAAFPSRGVKLHLPRAGSLLRTSPGLTGALGTMQRRGEMFVLEELKEES